MAGRTRFTRQTAPRSSQPTNRRDEVSERQGVREHLKVHAASLELLLKCELTELREAWTHPKIESKITVALRKRK